MTSAERHLTWFLRISAVMFLAALPFVAVPSAWMRNIAQIYGLAMPDSPLLEYLARHLSAFYGCMGGSYWFISRDIRRFMPLIRFTIPLTFVQAVIVVAIDIAVEMPWVWTIGEGLSMFAWIALLWWLLRRIEEPR